MAVSGPGRAVLFDLDGTLLDTLDDLADAMNAALATVGCDPHPVAAYRRFVGDGIHNAARRALPEDRRDDATVDAVVAQMRVEYHLRQTNKTRPYHGIRELLDELTRLGVPRCVFSNKPDSATQQVVAQLLGGWTFHPIRGARDDTPLKPAPDGALAVAAELGLPAHEVIYVGDTNTDMQCAVAAGMIPIGAAWGFRDADELLAGGAVAVIDWPIQVLDWLAKPARPGGNQG